MSHLICSEGAHDVEGVVVGVFPEARITEVGIIEELSAALCPPDWFRLRVSVDDRRIYS